MSGKTKIKLLLLCGAVLMLFSSCAQRKSMWEGGDYIYGINSDYTKIMKIAYEFPKGDVEEIVSDMLTELARPVENIEYLPAIPENVRVQKYEVDQEIAYIDFSKEYLEIQMLEEKLTRAAVVQSLLQIKGISGVWISVDGERLKNSEGKSVGLLTADDFVQNAGSSPSSYQTDTLTLYFANKGGDKLVEQKVDVKYNSNISKEKLIVEKLMAGPKKGEEAYPTLNPDATLLSVTTKDGICYVNFDSQFLNSVYDIMPELTIYSLVNSLVEGTSAETVQITVNGEKNVVYKEKIDLSQPLLEEMSWLQKPEEESGEKTTEEE